MLPLPLRPLVSLSALALLSWCWYTIRRRRRNLIYQVREDETAPIANMQSLKEDLVEQETATDVGRTSQDLKPYHHLHPLEKQEQEVSMSSGDSIDQNLNLEFSDCPHVSSPALDKLPVLPGASPAIITASSPTLQPLKGDRPEPEGEVSEAQASALVAEKLETETEKDSIASKGHTDIVTDEISPSWPESDTISSVQQSPMTICSKAHELPSLPDNLSEEEVEQLSYSLVKEAIRAATEEILATGDISLKRKDQEEPRETLLIDIQTDAQGLRDINKIEGLSVKEGKAVCSSVPKTPREDYCTLSHTAKGGVSSVDNPSDQSMSPSIFQAGEDSGCSTCYSEDGMLAEEATARGELSSGFTEEGIYSFVSDASESKNQETYHGTEEGNGKPPKQNADASKGANDVTCMNGENRVDSSETAHFSSSALTLWDVEVPAHLVGRLIGKQGKHIGFLKQISGAKIYVSTLPYTHEFQICHIEGTKVQVENALTLIRKKFKDLDLSNRRCHVQPLPSLPITSWLLLPQDRPVEVIVPRVEAPNYLFVQQHTHPTYYALRSLNEQMLFCYSRPGCPSLPTPVEAGVVCAAPSADGGWWRAQVIQHYNDSDTVQIRYVDYGGYITVNLSTLRQIRSDFVALPFQGSEVMLENIAPLPGKEEFSLEAKEALEELTQGVPLIIKVRNYLLICCCTVCVGHPLVLHQWSQDAAHRTLLARYFWLVDCSQSSSDTEVF
uniref:Tudor domain-containing protein n=1 Tax=Pygocentrus nattereri TaxID=42514 RepID=A0A3B4E1H8_PYGNA